MLPGFTLPLGFFLDLIFGDPQGFPHPVRLIGALIAGLEKLLRKIFPSRPFWEKTAGGILVLLTALLSTAIPWALLFFLWRWNPWAGFLVESFFCYQLLAVKSLKTESMKVYRELKKGDLPAARKAVSMIVGRDVQNLSAEQVTKAAVETVAENCSDGVASPLFFLAIGGAPLGFFYKAVNTMDSMIGYKNDRYLYFGRAAARLDDILNFIPARICACFMVAASALLGFDARNAWKIYRRDRYCHSSPNSAHTEAVCAGALRVQLAGNAYYFGKLVKKPTIGDPLRKIEAEDIPKANRLLYGTAVLLFLGSFCLRLAILFLLFFLG